MRTLWDDGDYKHHANVVLQNGDWDDVQLYANKFYIYFE